MKGALQGKNGSTFQEGGTEFKLGIHTKLQPTLSTSILIPKGFPREFYEFLWDSLFIPKGFS